MDGYCPPVAAGCPGPVTGVAQKVNPLPFPRGQPSQRFCEISQQTCQGDGAGDEKARVVQAKATERLIEGKVSANEEQAMGNRPGTVERLPSRSDWRRSYCLGSGEVDCQEGSVCLRRPAARTSALVGSLAVGTLPGRRPGGSWVPASNAGIGQTSRTRPTKLDRHTCRGIRPAVQTPTAQVRATIAAQSGMS